LLYTYEHSDRAYLTEGKAKIARKRKIGKTILE
jgi:hypothetical protein